MSQKDIFKKIKRATVAMAVVDFNNKTKPFEIVGSGFCIDSSGVIITCRHVLSAFMSKSIEQQVAEARAKEENKHKDRHSVGPFKLIKPFAVFYDTERSSTKLFALPTVVDMVMAKTDKDIGMVRVLKHNYFGKGYPFLEIEDYESINEGDDIGICGFPLGTYLKQQLGTVTSSFTKGIISSIIPAPGVAKDIVQGFQLNITATHGNSGGPVFSLATGKVFGVLAEGLPDPSGKIIPGIVKAVPVYSVLEAVGDIKSATPASIANMFSDGNKDA